MAVETPLTSPAHPDTGQTTAGNYFVSNYPPFSCWNQEAVAEVLAALQRPQAATVPDLGLYLHIPFCRKRCHFCYFRVYTDKHAAEIESYVEAALQELERYAAQPAVAGRLPRFVYFGGGTPSYLSARQLTRLFHRMRQLLPWEGAEEVTFECEPGTLTAPKLRTLRELGVTRLSLGIEHFNDHILEVNGRAHRSREILQAWEAARALDFPQLNIDLIAGMVDDTDATWSEAVRRTLELRPDSVTVYQMEIPHNTTIYRQMKEQGLLTAPVADWPTKRRWVRQAFEALEAAGYTACSAYTAVRDPDRTRFVYRDRLWQGADLLGLGVASFGHLSGLHYQNLPDWDPYLQALARGELPLGRGQAPNAEERLIREWILQLKLGHLSISYFRAKFGVEVLTRFAEPLKQLRDWGYLEVEGDAVRLNREGLLRVDRLVQEFFLPQHRGIRYS